FADLGILVFEDLGEGGDGRFGGWPDFAQCKDRSPADVYFLVLQYFDQGGNSFLGAWTNVSQGHGGGSADVGVVILEGGGQDGNRSLGVGAHFGEGANDRLAHLGVLVLDGGCQGGHGTFCQRPQLAQDVRCTPPDVGAFVAQKIGQGGDMAFRFVIQNSQCTASKDLHLLVVVLDQLFQPRNRGPGFFADSGQRQGGGAADVLVLVLEQVGQ